MASVAIILLPSSLLVQTRVRQSSERTSERYNQPIEVIRLELLAYADLRDLNRIADPFHLQAGEVFWIVG